MLEIKHESFKKFNFQNLPNNISIMIIGKRMTGKTYLAKNLTRELILYYNYNKSIGIVKTDEFNDLLTIVVNNYNTILDSSDEEDIITIVDDYILKKEEYQKFLNNKKSIVQTTSYLLSIPHEVRKQFDYIFLLSDSSIDYRKKIHKEFLGGFIDFDSFNEVFTLLTNTYSCMVINNKINTNNLKEKVFWYRAN